ncbi:MAG: winged helix-turn-helix transcriptional regulator [Nitrososphaeraceae archaeon]
MQSIKGQEEKSDNSIDDEEIVIQPQVKFVNCPIRTSLGVLGKKWTILIIRDIGVRKIGRFNRLLESILGLTPRVLSVRLKELEKEGLIECVEKKKSPMMVLWRLTEKGKDTLPILMQMVVFASKWYADVIFEDKRPRKFSEIFPQPEAREIITSYI